MKTTIRVLIIGYLDTHPGWKNKGEIIGYISELKGGYVCADGVGRLLRKMSEKKKPEDLPLLAVDHSGKACRYLLTARNAVEALETSNLRPVEADTKDFWADYDKRAESAGDYIQRVSEEKRKEMDLNLTLNL